jgi:hypothetical protein
VINLPGCKVLFIIIHWREGLPEYFLRNPVECLEMHPNIHIHELEEPCAQEKEVQGTHREKHDCFKDILLVENLDNRVRLGLLLSHVQDATE